MNIRIAILIVLVVLCAGACRVPQGVIEGTVCDEDARSDGLDWWVAAVPLNAMDRVTNALKLKIELSGKMVALRESVVDKEGACTKLYYDGYAATHEHVTKAYAELEVFKAGRPKGAAYDPALAMRSFDTYCIAASEMKSFITSIESCLGSGAP